MKLRVKFEIISNVKEISRGKEGIKTSESGQSSPTPPLIPNLNVISEPLVMPETPIEKAKKILKNVSKVEFDSFQEYGFVAKRQGQVFVTEGISGSSKARIEPDDIVITSRVVAEKKITSRASSIVTTLEDAFDIPEVSKYDLRSENILFCVIGSQANTIVVQGGGNLHPDFGGRPGNSSSFKLVFNSTETAKEFIKWLEENPNEALKYVIEQSIAKYNESGEFQETLLPIAKIRLGGLEGNKKVNTFSRPIKELYLKDLDTNNIVRRNYENTQYYLEAYTESNSLWDDQQKLEAEKNKRSDELPRNPQERSKRKRLINLNEEAPLTKLIRLFIK